MNYKIQITAFSIGAGAGILLTGLTLALALTLRQPLSALEAAAVFTSYASTVLFVLQMRQCYLWGAVTTLLYAELFRQSGLYGSASVQLYLLGALVYGYFRWGPDGNPRSVTTVSPISWWGAYAFASFALGGFAIWTSTQLGSPVRGLDAAILGGSILAQWLLDNKKLETWFVWAIVNVAAIYLYATQGLALVAMQYAYFLGNAIWGWYEWRQSMLADREAAENPLEAALRQGRAIQERHFPVDDPGVRPTHTSTNYYPHQRKPAVFDEADVGYDISLDRNYGHPLGLHSYLNGSVPAAVQDSSPSYSSPEPSPPEPQSSTDSPSAPSGSSD